jgi:hypothetical protein
LTTSRLAGRRKTAAYTGSKLVPISRSKLTEGNTMEEDMNHHFRPNVAGDAVLLGSAGLGLALVLLGLMWLFGQIVGLIFHIDFDAMMWPLIVLVPGVIILTGGLLMGGPLAEPLSIVGSMVMMEGGLMMFQNLTGMWASWAYAWALVVPGGAGIGLVLYGLLHDHPAKIQDGTRLLRAALVIFVVGFTFFELILGINGYGLGRFGWPLLLVGLGVLAMIRSLRHGRPGTE